MSRVRSVRKIVAAAVFAATGGILFVIFLAFLVVGFADEKWVVPFSVSFPIVLGGVSWVIVGLAYLRRELHL